ncbi:MAG: ion transporter, partial [Desulfovibrio sp.]
QIVMTLDNYDLQETFENAGVNYTISKNDVSSKMLASYIFEPDVARFNEDLLASASCKEDFDIQQYQVVPECPYANTPFAQVFEDLKRRLNVVPIGLSKLINGNRTLYKLPADDLPVEPGDYIVLITSGLRVSELESLLRVKEGVF